MKVKAGKGLEFRCQGKDVSETKEINVNVDHNVQVKLIKGSLIEVKESKKVRGDN